MPASPEKLLLSSILNGRDLKVALARGLSADMFHAFKNEWVWVEDYWSKYKRTPTKVAFRNKFPDFIVNPRVNDSGHFADEVRKHHARVLLTSTIRDSTNSLAEGDVDTALSLLQTKVVTIAAGLGLNHDTDIFSDYNDTLAEVTRRWEAVQLSGHSGIPTGFPTFDERLGGANPGDVWIIAARLGEGKSWVLQKMALSAVLDGNTGQFDALEQSRAQVSMRLHALLSGAMGKEIFDSLDLMHGKGFELTRYKAFLKEARQFLKGKLHVNDTSRGRVTPLSIATQIERNNPDIVFVDYLQLMSSTKDHQDIAAISGQIKTTAMEYQVPIICAAQLNRERGLSRDVAGPEAIGGSDAIGQDADVVVTMKQKSRRVILMKAAKVRNGEGGFKVWSHFEPGKGIFKEVSGNQAQKLIDEDMEAEDREALR